MSGKHFVALAIAILVLSVASAAFGQDATAAAVDPTSMIPDLIDAGGQPAALLLLGYLIFGRGGLTIGIRLSDEDRVALRPDVELKAEVHKLRDRYHDLANKMAGMQARVDP